MAEALAAVGVASSIIALVDFSLTLYGHIKEIVADVHDVPKSFRPINTQLPVLMRALEDIGKAFKDGKLDEETAKVLAPTVERFMTSIQELEKLLAGVLLDPKDRRSKKLWKTFKGVAKESEVKSIVEDIHGYVGILTFYLVASASYLQPLTDERLIKIRRWLLAPDSSINYQKALLERQANTGQWFLESSLYQNWRESGSSIWLHGIPGCGKTILSTTVVENIQQHTAEDPGKAVAYFYFDFKDQQKQEPDSLVRSLLYQLSQQFVSTPMELDRLYESCRDGENQPHSSALLAALQPVIQAFPHTFIIIDALDECTQRQDLMKVLREIFRWQIEGLHLLVTSRREGDIENTLGQILEKRSILSIQTEAVTHDIQLYIHERLSHDNRLQKWRTDSALHHEIETSLLRNARGMFRWAVCQLDFLGDCRNRRQLLQVLKDLPPTLDATYDRILATIRDSDQAYAFRILRWLTFATRPLNLHEVAEIAALEPDRDPTFDREEVLQDPNDVLSICSSLVVVTEERPDEHTDAGKQKSQHIPTVQLAHYSVKEYLVSQRIRTGPAAPYGLEITLCNTQIAKCCLQYLLQPEIVLDSHEGPLQDFTLKDYSANNWPTHVQDGLQSDESTNDLCFNLLGKRKRGFGLWLSLYNCEDLTLRSKEDIRIRDLAPRLFFASLFGLSDVVERLLKNGGNPNAQSCLFEIPLQAAARNGHVSTVRVLIERGADVNLVGNGKSALSAALSRNQVDMARLLIDHGADVESQCPYYGPTIHAAIEGGINAVQLLLEFRCDLYALSFCHRGGLGRVCHGNALQACAQYGDPKIAKLLVEHGAQVNGMQGGNSTALQYASEHGNLDMVNFLLAHDADIYEEDDRGKTAVHKALKEGHFNIAKVLIEHGTALTANPPRFNFDRALCKALYAENVDIATFLLEHGADPSAISVDGMSLLEHAYRSSDNVRLLLAHGADPNTMSISDIKSSPFLWAIRKGDLDLVKYFIDNGADPNGQGQLKGAPLVIASQGHMDVVRLLLERGADFWYHGELGSALEKVCAEGQIETAQLLISKGAPINQRDLGMVHPLQSASRYGHLDVAKYLLERGADVTAKIAGIHEAVSVGNMEMSNLLLEHLTAHDDGDAYFGEAFSRAAWAEPLTLCRVGSEKDRDSWSKCPADMGCAEWSFTKPFDMVQFLVEKGANLNARDDQGRTALLNVIQRRQFDSRWQLDIAEFLIEKGADLNVRDNERRTALQGTLWFTTYEVAGSRNPIRGIDLAKLLIERGADVNERDDQAGTILEIASQEGRFGMVKLLIEQGANIEESGSKFGSALIAASCSEEDNPEITNVLLQAGANVDTQHLIYGSALSAASKRGHIEIVQLLLERGASINSIVEAHGDALGAALQGSFEEARHASNKEFHWVKRRIVSVMELMVQRGANFASDSHVVDFVLQAAMCNDLDVMKMFLEGSDYSSVFNDEVLNIVLWISSCRGQRDMIHLLFSKKGNLDLQDCEIGQIEPYSLSLKSALSQSHFEIASILIRKGANTHLSHAQWRRHLQTAAADGNLEVIKFLLNKNTNLMQATESYSEALVAASASGHYAIVDFLLGKGTDVNAPSEQSGTALSVASSKGHYKLVELLVSKGADVNATTEEYGTALLSAAAEGHLDIARLLISKEANINATTDKLGSALYVAVSRKDRGLIDLLLRRGVDINAQGGEYGNPLQAALVKRDYRTARRLIQKGADINAQGGRFGNALQATLSVRSTNRTFLAMFDEPEVLDDQERHNMAMLLVHKGAVINAQGGEYGSALLAAFFNSHYDVAEALLREGADINSRTDIAEEAQVTDFIGDHHCIERVISQLFSRKFARFDTGLDAATAALCGGFPDTAEMLLLAEETPFVASATEYRRILFAAITSDNFNLATVLLDRAEDGVLSDNAINEFFLVAIASGQDTLAQALIGRGANVNARDEDGHSALQLATLRSNYFMVKILLERNADVNACSTEQGTVLQTAIMILNGILVFHFLEQGADLNSQGGRYGNALQAAIQSSVMQSIVQDGDEGTEDHASYLVHKFIDRGADINAQCGEYGSALQAALCLGKSKLAEILISKGANVHMLGGLHGNMIQAALSGGCHDLAVAFIRQGVDVNSNNGLDKAISTALSKGYGRVVELLLEKHKDFDLTEEDLGETLHNAVLEGDKDLVKASTYLLGKRAGSNGRQRKLNDMVTAALAHGRHDIFEFLVDEGAKVDLEAFWRFAET